MRLLSQGQDPDWQEKVEFTVFRDNYTHVYVEVNFKGERIVFGFGPDEVVKLCSEAIFSVFTIGGGSYVKKIIKNVTERMMAFKKQCEDHRKKEKIQ